MAEHGADVIVNYQNSKDLAEEVCEQARQKGVRAAACQGNIANEREVAPNAGQSFRRIRRY